MKLTNEIFEQEGAPEFLSRQDIGLKDPRRRFSISDLSVLEMIIHHGGSEEVHSLPEAVSIWKRWQLFHMNGKNWSDIAYSFGIAPDGTVLEGRGWGRISGATGAPYDQRSISINFIGAFEKQTPTAAALKTAAWFHQVAMPNYPNYGRRGNKGVSYHKMYSATACPGKNLIAVLDRLQIPTSQRRPESKPYGSFDQAGFNFQHGLQVDGWAKDPNSVATVRVDFYTNKPDEFLPSVGIGSTVADSNHRPDVPGSAFFARFDVEEKLGVGSHKVWAVLIDNDGEHVYLGPRDFKIPERPAPAPLPDPEPVQPELPVPMPPPAPPTTQQRLIDVANSILEIAEAI